MKKSFLTIIAFIAIVISSTPLCAQSNLKIVGKVFDKVEADKLFGKVLESKEVETQKLFDMLKKVDSYIMFNLMDDQVVVADKNRTLLSDSKVTLRSDDVMHLYSKARVDEVLLKGGKSVTYIERRTDVLTITNGVYTLEMSLTCPPICL